MAGVQTETPLIFLSVCMILMAAHFGFMRTITRYNEKRKLIMICFFLLMLRMLALKIVFGPLRKHANINQELLLQLVTRWLNYVIVFDKHGNYWWNTSFLNELQKNTNIEPNFHLLMKTMTNGNQKVELYMNTCIMFVNNISYIHEWILRNLTLFFIRLLKLDFIHFFQVPDI